MQTATVLSSEIAALQKEFLDAVLRLILNRFFKKKEAKAVQKAPKKVSPLLNLPLVLSIVD